MLEFIKMVLISLCVIVLIMLGIRKLSDVCDLTGLFRKDKSGRGKRRYNRRQLFMGVKVSYPHSCMGIGVK